MRQATGIWCCTWRRARSCSASAIAAAWAECWIAAAQSCSDQARSATSRSSIESDETSRVVFLLPQGGGTEVKVDGVDVLVVTGSSPLGASLVGKGEGDDVEVVVKGVRREYVVAQVR